MVLGWQSGLGGQSRKSDWGIRPATVYTSVPAARVSNSENTDSISVSIVSHLGHETLERLKCWSLTKEVVIWTILGQSKVCWGYHLYSVPIPKVTFLILCALNGHFVSNLKSTWNRRQLNWEGLQKMECSQFRIFKVLRSSMRGASCFLGNYIQRGHWIRRLGHWPPPGELKETVETCCWIASWTGPLQWR